ncbi:MAG: FAD-binding oxidoreductase [bacterium]
MTELEFLEDCLESDQISDSDDVLEEHSGDFGLQAPSQVPGVVVYPESTEDASSVLEAAYEQGVPVTPYAMGTGLEGMAVPARDGISLDVTRMDSIVSYQPEDLLIEVECGLVGSDVNERVRSDGLYFPCFPTSGDISSIGGMIANDASGQRTIKYGEVHDWVRALEVVLPDGRVIKAGSKAAKTSSGYNLKDLFVGSEGTLGVVTKAVLELTGRPEQRVRARAIFSDLESATEAVSDLIRSGVDLASVELVDALSMTMANAYLDMDLPEKPALFLEFHADHHIQDEVNFAQSILETHGPENVQAADRPEDMESLWEARRELAYAVASYRENLTPVQPGDVTVPISKFPELAHFVKELGEANDYLMPCFGHAGDGNLHYTVLVDDDNPDHQEGGVEIYNRVVEKALELEGTATGEHGIGTGKKKFLRQEHGEHGVAAMQSIKNALDPRGLMNPGAIFPEP